MDKQYTIGQFAALNKITPRILRHYDKIGLMKPAAVMENGYRAYTSSQIRIVSKIREYQSCRFSLTEIKAMICADENVIRQLAKDKMEQLRSVAQEEQAAWAGLTRLSQVRPQACENRYDISFAWQSEQILLCSNSAVSEDEAERVIDSLFQTLHTISGEPCGLLLLLSDLGESTICRAAVPICAEAGAGGEQYIHLDAAWYLSVFHFGDYYDIGMAYDRLMCYADLNDYELEPPFMERYYVDARYAVSPEQYITQILVKITP